MHKALHRRDDIDRLYASRKEGEEDSPTLKIASIHCLCSVIHRLCRFRQFEDYIKKNQESLFTATRNNSRINRTTITRKQKWEEKQLYEYFKRQTSEISHEKTWTWLRKGNLKRETESLPMAAPNNAIRTNYIKAKIDKTQQDSKCRLRDDWDETINDMVSECSELAQKEYKTWLDA